jgi:hypothetical protein
VLIGNFSFRPSAIVKVALRDAQGVDINEREYGEQVGLPRSIDPWRVVPLKLVMEGPDYQRADKLVLRDMDDHEVAIPLKDRGSYGKWVEFP